MRSYLFKSLVFLVFLVSTVSALASNLEDSVCASPSPWKNGMLPSYQDFIAPYLNFRQCVYFGKGQQLAPCQASLNAISRYLKTCTSLSSEIKTSLSDLEILSDPNFLNKNGLNSEQEFSNLNKLLSQYANDFPNPVEFSAYVFNAYISNRDHYSYILPESAFNEEFTSNDSLHLEYQIDDNLETHAVVKIALFMGDSLPDELALLLFQIREAQIDNLIIDLRGNPGGEPKIAMEMLAQFYPTEQKFVTYLESPLDDLGSKTAHFLPIHQQNFDGKITVWVDHDTASAAELFAAAIKDSGRGNLLGEKTYGKGVLQSVYTLFDTENEDLRVLIVQSKSILYRGNGMTYNQIGIN